MVRLGFSKDMGLMRYILKLWRLLGGTSEEFGLTRIMFPLGPLRLRNIEIAQNNQKLLKNVQRKAALEA
jgi:hypothetical protein